MNKGVNVRVCRVYDPRTAHDGVRVLVDRLWPRGVAKGTDAFDEWCKDAAPSTDLRRWYGHDAARFGEFRSRYLAELAEPGRAAAVEHLVGIAASRRLTLVTATKDLDRSAAAVLAERLRG